MALSLSLFLNYSAIENCSYNIFLLKRPVDIEDSLPTMQKQFLELNKTLLFLKHLHQYFRLQILSLLWSLLEIDFEIN